VTPAADTISTERLTLRRPGRDDLAAYTAFCASPRSVFVKGPFPASRAFEKLATMVGQWALRGFGRYVMVLDDAPIGHVGPLSYCDNTTPELTWTLWDGAQEGRGFATEAARAVARHLFDDLNWDQLDILVLPDNNGSIRVAQKLGAALTDRPAPDWYQGCHTYELRRGLLQ